MACAPAEPVTVVRRRRRPQAIDVHEGATPEARSGDDRQAAVEARLIREEAIRRGTRLYWPGCDAGWPEWCVLGDRMSPYAGFDPDQDAIHAGLIEAVSAWRRASPIDAVDLESVLPYLTTTSREPELFLLPDRLAEPIETSPAAPAPLQLDPDLLDGIEADTAVAVASLCKTFEPEPPPTPQRMGPQPPAHVQGPLVPGAGGLDLAHGRVLRALSTRPSWTTAEVTALCREHGLRLAGALDVLNDTAYDLCGRPFLELPEDPGPHQPLAINHDVLQEMLQ